MSNWQARRPLASPPAAASCPRLPRLPRLLTRGMFQAVE